MKKVMLLALLIVGCSTIPFKERNSEEILLGTWAGNMIMGTKLNFTFLSGGVLKTNFSDGEDVLTWDVIDDTLTFYGNVEVDDVVYLTIINENKFVIKGKQTDSSGMQFHRKITHQP